MKKHLSVFVVTLFSVWLPLAAFEISLTSSEKADIETVISSFAKDNTEELMKEAEMLMPKVMSLMRISPLQTMAYISQDDQLKENMRKSRTDHFKWNIFMKGFSSRMMQEKQFADLEGDLPDFAEYVSLDLDILCELADEDAWGDFVCYVLDN